MDVTEVLELPTMEGVSCQKEDVDPSGEKHHEDHLGHFHHIGLIIVPIRCSILGGRGDTMEDHGIDHRRIMVMVGRR